MCANRSEDSRLGISIFLLCFKNSPISNNGGVVMVVLFVAVVVVAELLVVRCCVHGGLCESNTTYLVF